MSQGSLKYLRIRWARTEVTSEPAEVDLDLHDRCQGSLGITTWVSSLNYEFLRFYTVPIYTADNDCYLGASLETDFRQNTLASETMAVFFTNSWQRACLRSKRHRTCPSCAGGACYRWRHLLALVVRAYNTRIRGCVPPLPATTWHQ